MRRPLLVVTAYMTVLAAFCLLGRLAGRAWAENNRGTESPKPGAVLNYEQSNGKKLFEHYCAVCHGASGEGDGFNAFNLNPRPRNLADGSAMARFSDQRLFDAIAQGGWERGKSNLMPPWRHTLNDRQIRYLTAYLRILGRPRD